MPPRVLLGNEMPNWDYSYLDQLDRMRRYKPATSAPKKRTLTGTVARLKNNGQAAPATRLNDTTVSRLRRGGTPAPATRLNAKPSATSRAAAAVPATQQRNAGVRRTSTPRRPIAPARNVGPATTTKQRYNYGSVSSSPTGSYGGSPTSGLVGAPSMMAAPVTPPVPSIEDYLPTDSVFVAEKAGIDADTAALLSSLKRDRASYDVDFGSALRNLGWELGDQGLEAPGQGSWRQQDLTGAYGNAYNTQQNDYAGRGMLTSSFYGNALEDLLASFDQQRNDMISARQRQIDDWTAQGTDAETQQRQAIDRARAAALARRAATYSLGGF